MLIAACFFAVSIQAQTQAAETRLNAPLRELFQHSKHTHALLSTSMKCTDCHRFSIHARSGDPLDVGVPKGMLQAPRGVCHKCHLEKLQVPVSRQCVLCHQDQQALVPKDHHQNWKTRHGKCAQADPDACAQCHSPRSCTECHTQRDALKVNVHRPGFRVTHSIEARVNPQSCTVCHSSTQFCTQCHTRGF